jgi:hypothetical protein
MNDPTGGPPPGDAGAEPSEEEMRAALEEQMRNITVQDVLMQTVVTLVNLAARRLGLAEQPGEAGDRDLEQARVAIDAVRALIPLCPQEGMEQVQQAVSQLQIAYAKERGGAPGEPGAAPPGPGAGPAGESPPSGQSKEEAERAKARSKLWTPGGS